MKKFVKKAVALLLCAAMLMSIMMVNVFAVEIVASGDLTDDMMWVLTDDGTLTISGEGQMEDYNTSDAPWSAYIQEIIMIVIEEGVTKIGDWAFAKCINAESVSIPKSVTWIGTGAFCDSGITDIVIPKGVTGIGDRAFKGCIALANVTLSATVEEIGEEAFLNCSALQEITIPAAVFMIGEYAFNGCTSMKAFHVDKDNENYESDENGILFCKNKSRIVKVPATTTGVFTIPDRTSLGVGAFDSCNLITSVVFPKTVYFVGEGAFKNCTGVTEIILSDSIEGIGDFAFSGCTSLKSINIPKNVEEIGLNPFIGCTSLESIRVDQNNANFSNDDNGVLYNKDKTALLSVPGTVAGTLNIAKKVKSIDEYAFLGCVNLAGVSVNSNNPYFCSDKNNVLYNKDKTTLLFAPKTLSGSYVVSESITTIGAGAFGNCTELTEITLPENLTEIHDNAFENCKSLKSITIPEKVITMLPDVFNGCTELDKIKFTGNMPFGMNSRFLRGVPATVYYPAGDATWDHAAMKSFGDDVTWVAYPGIKGDVNEDGDITNADLVIMARFIVGFKSGANVELYGDMDDDGRVTNSDLIVLARMIVGL